MCSLEPAVVDAILAKAGGCSRDVLVSTLELAGEITHEGHKGRSVGALFTLGNADRVLECSRPLILDPLQGHAPRATHITDAGLRGTVKKLAQLDGAFVIAEDGTVVGACRYLDTPAAGVRMPLGLGTRHVAAAAVSKSLGVVTIVVSETGRMRVFCAGDLLADVRVRAT